MAREREATGGAWMSALGAAMVLALGCGTSHFAGLDGGPDEGGLDGGPDDAMGADAGGEPAPVCTAADGCRVVQVLTGYQHTCALLDSGEVACWGGNERAELGTALPASSARPLRVSLAPGRRLLPPAEHTCAVTVEAVLCWGGPSMGLVASPQLEPNGEVFSPFPEAVDGAVGFAHACGVDRAGEARCWGSQSGNGQLGNGTRAGEGEGPFRVLGLPPTRSIDAGFLYSCAVGSDTTLRCWGSNTLGEIGDGTGGDLTSDADALAPVRVLERVVRVSTGDFHACAFDEDGAVWCWGSNTHSQVGFAGSTHPVASPWRVALPRDERAIDVSAEGSMSCAVGESGRVYCWGENAPGGSLGVGDPSPFQTTTPLEVLDIRTATAVAVGGAHACAIVDDGDLACWGQNEDGRLGDGTTVDRPSPVPVVGLR